MSKQNTKEQKPLFDQEMVDTAINYWFNDHEKIRSPFPEYIRKELAIIAEKKYREWTHKISPEAQKEINDDIQIERFEEFLFEEARKLVSTEDEKITIKYPFMLRTGDIVKHNDHIESEVIERKITTQNNTSYLNVTLKEIATGKTWETAFELFE